MRWKLGDFMRSDVKGATGRLPDVRQIRGQGLMIGIELSRPCGELVKEALKQGLLINVTSDRVVRLLPPLVMQRSEAEQVVNILSALVKDSCWHDNNRNSRNSLKSMSQHFHVFPNRLDKWFSIFMQIKHFLQFNDFSREEFEYLFERARWIKHEFKQYRRYWPLEDRTLAMIFDKHSTRTRLII